MSIVFTARRLGGAQVVLAGPVPVTPDPRLASQDFTLDELLAFAVPDEEQGQQESVPDELPPGQAWRVAGERSMARHGSSALDTDVRVRLLVPEGSGDDPDPLLGRAMMLLALAMARPDDGVLDERFTGTLG